MNVRSSHVRLLLDIVRTEPASTVSLLALNHTYKSLSAVSAQQMVERCNKGWVLSKIGMIVVKQAGIQLEGNDDETKRFPVVLKG